MTKKCKDVNILFCMTSNPVFEIAFKLSIFCLICRSVYYSDWVSNPHISKVDYSGKNAVMLIDTDIEEPNALAIAGLTLFH